MPAPERNRREIHIMAMIKWVKTCNKTYPCRFSELKTLLTLRRGNRKYRNASFFSGFLRAAALILEEWEQVEKFIPTVHVIHVLTCCVDVKVGGFVGDVSWGLEAWSLGSGLAGVSLSHADLHLEGTLGDVLSCKQHCHLQNKKKRVKIVSGTLKSCLQGVRSSFKSLQNNDSSFFSAKLWNEIILNY